MESLAKKFAEAGNWGREGFAMRRYDKFGTMFGFHVRGAYNYQTKVGAIFTLIYWCLVMVTFGYYLFKWTDKSKPSVMWNEYRSQVYPEIDLWKENYHFYTIPIDIKNGVGLSWDQFWSSFSIYASIMDLSKHLYGTGQSWTRIPFQRCSEQEWAKALPDTDMIKQAILDYGVCLDPLKAVKGPLSQFKETLPIRGGTGAGSQRVLIDIYHCLPGGALPTTGVPTTCDPQSSDIAVKMMIYEKTVNVKYYEQPVGSAHSRMDIFVPATTLRFVNELHIK
jgi:hypothetical protein